MSKAPPKPPAKPPALGPRLHAIRKARGLTLDELSERSGISKSMLSQIERGQTNPTFGTLWNITQSLGLELSELVEAGVRKPGAAIERLAGNLTPTIASKDGGCLLRILSPPGTAGLMEWYELTVEPGRALESEPHGLGAMEHLTCLAGRLQVRWPRRSRNWPPATPPATAATCPTPSPTPASSRRGPCWSSSPAGGVSLLASGRIRRPTARCPLAVGSCSIYWISCPLKRIAA